MLARRELQNPIPDPFNATTFWPRTQGRGSTAPEASIPAINICQQGGGYLIECALPGFRKEDGILHVTVLPSERSQARQIRIN